MTEQSMYNQLRQINFALNRLWNATDPQSLEAPARKSLDAVRRQVQAAQATIRDYELLELEEDTKAQLRILPKAVKALEQLRSGILKSSEYDLIGPVDVAQLTAELDELIDKLR